ncbi:MAG: hypothetical protein A2Y86_04170 [Candidatus Aminicenantes bacterium RBG_13_62_12]|nr:MAG: hypothetical protein A2Y86_04170 [Candidatus Aminicenantes bacterium RBG_13_62_12]
MRRIFHGGLIMLLLSAAALSAAMNNKVTVAQAGGKIRWTKIALGPEGIAHVVYSDELEAEVRTPILYVSYNGQNASSPFLVTRSWDTAAMQASVAVSSRGLIAVVWSEPRSDSIFLRVFDPAANAWLTEERVSNWGSDEPEVVVDKDGNIHVFFYDGGEGRIYVRSKVNGVWEPHALISKSDARCVQGGIALDSEGYVWVVWLQRDCSDPSFCQYKVHYRKRLSTTPGWTSQHWVNEEGLSQERPAIAVGPDNIPWITWTDVNHDESAQVVVCRLDMNEPPLERITGSWTQHFPKIAVDINNKPHIAVQQGAGDEGDGILYLTNAGGSWTQQMMDGPWTKCGGIAADGYGNVAVSWSGFYGDGSHVYINSIEPVSPKYFYAPVNLSSSLIMSGARKAPKITYNLSWSANPENDDRYLNGYNIYMKEDTGSFQLLEAVTKSTFSRSFEFDQVNVKRVFAISTVNLGGAESVLEEF